MTDGVAWRFDSVAYTGADERAIQSMLLHPSSSLLARAGRRPGPGLEVTIGGTPEAATVAAGGGVITESAVGGSYVFAIPTPVSLTLPARPSAGTSRIDYVLVRILNETARPGDTLREPDVYLLSGTAGASPTPPTIPTGHLRLARLDVPASGTIAVSQPPQRMAAAGGIILTADQTVRDAIEQIYDGLMVYREDIDAFQGRINGAWVTVGGDDTGWQDISFNTGYALSGYAKIRRIGNRVSIAGAVLRSAGNFAANTTYSNVATLPSQYRPTVGPMQWEGTASADTCRIALDSSGNITLVTRAAALTAVWLDHHYLAD